MHFGRASSVGLETRSPRKVVSRIFFYFFDRCSWLIVVECFCTRQRFGSDFTGWEEGRSWVILSRWWFYFQPVCRSLTLRWLCDVRWHQLGRALGDLFLVVVFCPRWPFFHQAKYFSIFKVNSHFLLLIFRIIFNSSQPTARWLFVFIYFYFEDDLFVYVALACFQPEKALARLGRNEEETR